jgi:hypothetical protein
MDGGDTWEKRFAELDENGPKMDHDMLGDADNTK